MNKLAKILFLFFIFTFVFPKSLFAGPSLTFNPDLYTIVKGGIFSIDIIINTDGQPAAGAGAKVIFNPNDLAVVSLLPGTIFASYPGMTFNNETGKLTVSGIADNLDNQFNGKDVFGTVTFQSKEEGTSTVNFDFVPGSTTDSNIAVIYGSGDILAEVNSLSVTVNPDTTMKADANADSLVDGLDYVVWLKNYGASVDNGAKGGDFDRNSKVDDADYLAWLVEYNL